MIKRGVARYNSQTGKWEWGRAAEKIEILNARAPLSAAVVRREASRLLRCPRPWAGACVCIFRGRAGAAIPPTWLTSIL
jgi:hypothetical protein